MKLEELLITWLPEHETPRSFRLEFKFSTNTSNHNKYELFYKGEKRELVLREYSFDGGFVEYLEGINSESLNQEILVSVDKYEFVDYKNDICLEYIPKLEVNDFDLKITIYNYSFDRKGTIKLLGKVRLCSLTDDEKSYEAYFLFPNSSCPIQLFDRGNIVVK